ncbi:hypothetical protein K474DRAFT_1001960 [Panus rudis PR-1116 ss-1]|nr:hypothetical protein K474DRAFT_1001960 [Panus rudis PR-1116 ss-1]
MTCTMMFLQSTFALENIPPIRLGPRSSFDLSTLVTTTWAKSNDDALILIEAARRGLIPTVMRQLNDGELDQFIVSGSVVVYRASDYMSPRMHWQDGRSWSLPGQIKRYKVYREIKRSFPHQDAAPAFNAEEYRSCSGATPTEGAAEIDEAPGAGSTISQDDDHSYAVLQEIIGGALTGLPDALPNGLIKRRLSVQASTDTYMLISYFSPGDVLSRKLLPASEHPSFSHIVPGNDLITSFPLAGSRAHQPSRSSERWQNTTESERQPYSPRHDLNKPEVIRCPYHIYSHNVHSGSGIEQQDDRNVRYNYANKESRGWVQLLSG